MTMYKYRAIKKGVLSRPYRFVDEGEIVSLNEPIDPKKCSWLIPADQPVPKPSNILVPYMKIDGKVQRPDYNSQPPTAHKLLKDPLRVPDERYDTAIKTLEKFEEVVDGETPEAKEETIEGGDSTGDQEVL